MQVIDLAEAQPETVDQTLTLREAARLMAQNYHHAVGVVNGETFVGMFTDHDLTVAIADGADAEIGQVRDWMTAVPDAINADVSVGEALKWMVEGNYRHLPLTDDTGKLVAMVSMRDLVSGALAS